MRVFAATKLMVLAALLAANFSLHASPLQVFGEDCSTSSTPSCCKNCGAGEVYGYYWRDCQNPGDQDCDVTWCHDYSQNCEYSTTGTLNDECFPGSGGDFGCYTN